MAWNPDDNEVEALLAALNEKRYEYFVKRVADAEEVWSLAGEGGWVLMGDDNGRQMVPVWPHARYAWECVQGAWLGSSPQPIPLHDWLEKWIPGMERDGRLVAVFPTPDEQAVVVTPGELRAHIEEELERYE